MEVFYYISVFIFGSIIGSFLNVVINRHNTGISLGGRSSCFSCGGGLAWYQLIPILSFIIQNGKCGMCKSKISLQYPIVEFLTGVLFLAIVYRMPVINYSDVLNTVYFWTMSSLLVIIVVYDFKHKIIPNSFVYSFIILSFLSLFGIFVLDFNFPSYWELFSGIILAFPFAFLWLISRGTWMGLGDAKLTLGIGWMLGLYYGSSAVMIAFWIGAIVGVILIIIGRMGLFLGSKKLTMKSEIPFGPFLILGLFIVLLFNIDVLNLLI